MRMLKSSLFCFVVFYIKLCQVNCEKLTVATGAKGVSSEESDIGRYFLELAGISRRKRKKKKFNGQNSLHNVFRYPTGENLYSPTTFEHLPSNQSPVHLGSADLSSVELDSLGFQLNAEQSLGFTGSGKHLETVPQGEQIHNAGSLVSSREHNVPLLADSSPVLRGSTSKSNFPCSETDERDRLVSGEESENVEHEDQISGLIGIPSSYQNWREKFKQGFRRIKVFFKPPILGPRSGSSAGIGSSSVEDARYKQHEYFDANESPVKNEDIPYRSDDEAELIFKLSLCSVQSMDQDITEEPNLFWTTYSGIIHTSTRCTVSEATVLSGSGYLTHIGFVASTFTFRVGSRENWEGSLSSLFSLQSKNLNFYNNLNNAWALYARDSANLKSWRFRFNRKTGLFQLIQLRTSKTSQPSFYPILNVVSILKRYVIPTRRLKERVLKFFGVERPLVDIVSMSDLDEKYLTGTCELCDQFESVEGAVRISQAFLKGILYEKQQTLKKKEAFKKKYALAANQKTKKQAEFLKWFNKRRFLPFSEYDLCNGESELNVVAVNYIPDSKKHLHIFFTSKDNVSTLQCVLTLSRKIYATFPIALQKSPRIKFSPPIKMRIVKKKFIQIV